MSKFPFDVCRPVAQINFKRSNVTLRSPKLWQTTGTVTVSDKIRGKLSVAKFIICTFHYIVHKPIVYFHIKQYLVQPLHNKDKRFIAFKTVEKHSECLDLCQVDIFPQIL